MHREKCLAYTSSLPKAHIGATNGPVRFLVRLNTFSISQNVLKRNEKFSF